MPSPRPFPSGDPPPPTIKEVASECGVSTATVSRALNDLRHCDPTTRQRVLETAKRLGYRKNAAGAMLGASRRRSATPLSEGMTIGCLSLPWPEMAPANTLKFGDQVSKATGHRLMKHRLTTIGELPALMRMLAAQGGESLLLDLQAGGAYWELEAPWENFAVATFSSERSDSPFHQVARAYYQEIRSLWQSLVARGYTRIGAILLSHPHHEETDIQRFAAVAASQAEHASHLEAIPVLLPSPREEPQQLPRWLKAHRPDVVVSFGIGTWWLLDELGLRVPEDVGLAVLHGGGRVVEKAGSEIPLSGYRVDDSRVLLAAVGFLDNQIRHGQFGKPPYRQFLEIAAEWVEGSTLRPEVRQRQSGW